LFKINLTFSEEDIQKHIPNSNKQRRKEISWHSENSLKNEMIIIKLTKRKEEEQQQHIE